MTGSLAYYNPHTKWLVAILYAKQLTRVLDTQMISNLRFFSKPKTIDDSEEMLGPKMKASLKKKNVSKRSPSEA